jgi:hypothetical protein
VGQIEGPKLDVTKEEEEIERRRMSSQEEVEHCKGGGRG